MSHAVVCGESKQEQRTNIEDFKNFLVRICLILFALGATMTTTTVVEQNQGRSKAISNCLPPAAATTTSGPEV